MAKKVKAFTKRADRGGAYLIRSAEGRRVTVKGSRSGDSAAVRQAIKSGQYSRKSRS